MGWGTRSFVGRGGNPYEQQRMNSIRGIAHGLGGYTYPNGTINPQTDISDNMQVQPTVPVYPTAMDGRDAPTYIYPTGPSDTTGSGNTTGLGNSLDMGNTKIPTPAPVLGANPNPTTAVTTPTPTQPTPGQGPASAIPTVENNFLASQIPANLKPLTAGVDPWTGRALTNGMPGTPGFVARAGDTGQAGDAAWWDAVMRSGARTS